MNRFWLAIMLSVTFYGPRVMAEDDLKATLLTNWEKLSRFESTQAQYSVDFKGVYDGHELSRDKRIYIAENRGKIFTRSEQNDRVFCWNPDYAFAIKSDNRGKDWLLIEMVVASPGINPLKKMFISAGKDGEVIFPLTWFWQDTCLNHLKEGRFVLGAQSKLENALYRIEIQFNVNFAPQLPERAETLTGFISVDPSNHYVIREAVLNRANPPRRAARQMSMNRQYSSSSGSLHVASIDYDNNAGQAEHFVFHDYSSKPVPGEEFKASQYGLPEPMLGVAPASPPTPRYVWLIVAAVVLTLAALAVSYLRRRSLTRAATPGGQS